ncbi:hypothetical protein N0V82_005120 [Gnomoniopsis sp. IMI 355080]|nr:hypothetical protein N0V82_005120 [Gnomoniopsis sp. IMI 355080]
MQHIVCISVWAILGACLVTPHNSRIGQIAWNRGSTYYDLTPLQNKLSANASVIYPNDTTAFDTATARWSSYDAPKVSVVVVPGSEKDVAETVKYAADNDIPFLAVNGGHGAITTVGSMTSGIEIWMHQLHQIKIAEDGKSVTIGGGALSGNVTHDLWTVGKQTVTGGYQFLSMNIVLANGTSRTIDSSSDLWWAIQGAGHNFGLVTAVTSKIYDIEYPVWAYKHYVFTGDKVYQVYDNINKYLLKNGTQPVDIANYGYLYNNQSISDKPTSVNIGSGNYTEIAKWVGWDFNASVCQNKVGGTASLRFPIDLVIYNGTALQNAYDLFATAVQDTPALNGSVILIEGYATRGLQSIPQDSTAVSFRQYNLLLSPLMRYVPDGEALAAKAISVGQSLRNVLREGTGRKDFHAYVNYAFGTETKEEMYGHEKWRQDKLLALKNKYDPYRRFSFYAPIA